MSSCQTRIIPLWATSDERMKDYLMSAMAISVTVLRENHIAPIGVHEPALTRTPLNTRRRLLRLGSPVPRPQARSDEPRQGRADHEACQHNGRNGLERVIDERGDHQDGNDADAEGDGVRHHEHERSDLKACRHCNPFRIKPRVYLGATVG